METIYSRRLWGYPWACQVSAGSRCRRSWCGAAAAARWPPGPPRPPCRAPPRRAVTSRGCSPCLQLMATEFNWGSITRYLDINLCYASFYVSSNILQKYLSVFHWPQNSDTDTMSQLSTNSQPIQREEAVPTKMDQRWRLNNIFQLFTIFSRRPPPATGHTTWLGTGPSLCHETLRHETRTDGKLRAKESKKQHNTFRVCLSVMISNLRNNIGFSVTCAWCLTKNWQCGNVVCNAQW